MRVLRNKTLFLLFCLTLLGTVLRLLNISPLKLYPDSYQNLLVALNLQSNGHVTGTMGDGGMFYPDYLAWTRPVLPLLINLANLFINPLDRSAQAIILLNGLLAIPLAYLFIKQVFNSNTLGLIASLLVSLSFNHIVWGGFILTETTGILLQFILLSLVFSRLQSKTKFGDFYDLTAGLVFGLAVMTRYEYAVLLIPVLFLFFRFSPTPLPKIINFLVSTSFVVSLFIVLLFPSFPWLALFNQTIDSFKTFALITLFFALALTSLFVLKKSLNHLGALNILLILLLWSLVLLTPFLGILAGLKFFSIYDFLLIISFLIGITIFLKTTNHYSLAYFCLIAIISLSPIYVQMNEDMQRYWTHLLPYFLIPSVYGLRQIYFYLSRKNIYSIIILFLLVMAQIFVSTLGLKNWGGGAWFTANYEETIAKYLLPKLPESNFILLTSLPEAYYFASRAPTHSITTTPPYIYLSNTSPNTTIYIFQDIGMADQFPEFNRLIELHLSSYQIDQFTTNIPYHYGSYYKTSSSPVKIYKLPLSSLTQIIDQTTD